MTERSKGIDDAGAAVASGAEPPEPPEPPAHWEADVVASDGGTVHLRPIRPEDAPALEAFHAGLSQRTRYLRFFSAYPKIPPRDLHRFTNVDHHDRVAFVATLGDKIIAVGRYERVVPPGVEKDSERDPREAEVAFVVADDHQGRGIGSVLLEHLAAAGRERGLRRFTAVVLLENAPMMRVFRDAGYEISRRVESGEVNFAFDIDETAVTEAVTREREQRAEARSIARLLCPQSVALVGASNHDRKIGNVLFGNLLRMGFEGPLYPVNPHTRHVRGVRAYPDLLDIPDAVDLAVLVVPASEVPGVVEQCEEKNVRGLVVVSGGYGERGTDSEREDGRDAQRDLVLEARVQGMRVVGPNCLGIINTDPKVRLNASLAPLPPLTGRAGFFCQSGALGVAVLGEAARRGLGISTFVSAGNRADVSGNDMLQFWETDPRTDVVLMYLESFGNPRKSARLARRLGRTKPIVAIKGGTRMLVPGLEHTSVDVPEESVRALFEASGIIRVDTVGDLFDVALLLTSQPLPAGRRVAVVGNSIALAALVTNALAEDGLRLARLDDVGVDAGPDAVESALRIALADPGVDSVFLVFVPPIEVGSQEEVALTVRTVAAGSEKLVVSTFLGIDGVPAGLAAAGDTSPAPGSVPSYPSPERAVRALARVSRYALWRRRSLGVVPELGGVDIAAARELVNSVLAATYYGRDLTFEETRMLLECVGLRLTDRAPGDGIEVVLSAHEDPSFGALVSFGLRGVATDLLGDRAYAAVPLTTTDAADLIAAPRAAPLLAGYAGGVAVDREALRDLALRLSALADALPELTECVLAVTAGPNGVAVTGAEIWLGPSSGRPDTGPRRLPGL